MQHDRKHLHRPASGKPSPGSVDECSAMQRAKRGVNKAAIRNSSSVGGAQRREQRVECMRETRETASHRSRHTAAMAEQRSIVNRPPSLLLTATLFLSYRCTQCLHSNSFRVWLLSVEDRQRSSIPQSQLHCTASQSPSPSAQLRLLSASALLPPCFPYGYSGCCWPSRQASSATWDSICRYDGARVQNADTNSARRE